MGTMQRKAATLLVREKRFHPQTLRIQAPGFLGVSHMGQYIQRVLLVLCPATLEKPRPLGGVCHAGIP